MKTYVVLDTECYSNYFLVCFKSSKLTKFYELHHNSNLNRNAIKKILENYTTVGFNSINYDLPMLSHALDPNSTNASLKTLSDAIIVGNLTMMQRWNMFASLGISYTSKNWDHIDLFNIAPKIDLEQKVGLKAYGARFNTKILQDLPIKPSSIIKNSDHYLLRKYCENDVNITKELFDIVTPSINLRITLSKQFNLDLRSSSDAQISEKLVRKVFNIGRVENTVCEDFKYIPLENFQFKSVAVNDWVQALKDEVFTCDHREFLPCGKRNGKIGTIIKPTNVTRNINIGGKVFSVAIGGMHSVNKAEAYESTKLEYILDVDFASYYPSIMITMELFPRLIGIKFLTFYQHLYRQKGTWESLKNVVKVLTYKIMLNGCFGKLASIYSCMYDPVAFLNVTINGQLTCFKLIEKLSELGCQVISANTDGVTFKGSREDLKLHKVLIDDWAHSINLKVNMIEYKAIYHESVNSYIAIKQDNTIKGKGTFADVGLSKTPAIRVCVDAIFAWLLFKTPIRTTILANIHDINKFITARAVKSGGYWQGKFLGKIVRWYYGVGGTPILNEKLHKVAGSNDAIPLMNLDKFKIPINIDAYVVKTYELLNKIGIKL